MKAFTLFAMILAFAVVFEAFALVELATYPNLPDSSLLFAQSDAAAFTALAPLTPAFLILLLYVWIARLAVSLRNKISRSLKAIVRWFTQSLPHLSAETSQDSKKFSILNYPRQVLIVSIVAAILLALQPYRPDLNPSMTPVGVDAHFYIDWVNQMLARSPSSAISYAMGGAAQGSRPLLLVPMYLAVSTGLISTNQSIEYLPVFLSPLLAVATFLFVREGQKSERWAGVASLFSVFSFSTTVGFWAGFYANWLALTEAYLFLTFLIKFSETPTRQRLLVLLLTSISLLLTHAYTWLLILALATVFVLSVVKDSRKTTPVRPLILILVTNILLDLVKSQIFGGSIAAQDASQSLNTSGVSQPLNLWQNITSGLLVAYNGLLGNAVLVGISVVAVLVLKYSDRFDRLLTLWVALGSIPFPFLSSLIQTRIMYDLPIPALTTLGLIYLIRPLQGRNLSSNLAIALVLLLAANYALRAVTFLVAVPF